jgi:hypothetical protein
VIRGRQVVADTNWRAEDGAMALELRPICEHCAVALPPESGEAMICSFECTFCRTCVDEVLFGVCPNCGGNFEPRPIRPATERRPGASLATFPASIRAVHNPVDVDAHRAFVTRG